MISGSIERLIFWSRWLLSPLYLGLIGVLLVLVYRFAIDFFGLIIGISEDGDHNAFVLDLLALLDLVLLANLILIVLFAGYENFVSKIETAEKSVDRPYWMGTVDFSGLKIKLIGSLVAISVIELLKDFIELSVHPEQEVGQGTIWRVLIHLTFVLSGVLFAVMDWIAGYKVPQPVAQAAIKTAKKPATKKTK
jgi:uncharacterized protein (TIGR00645 family)